MLGLPSMNSTATADGVDQIAFMATQIKATAYKRMLGTYMLSSFILLVYDHILTFRSEVNEVWNHPPNAVTVTFLLVRYFTIITRFLDVFIYFYSGWTPSAEHYQSCEAIRKLRLPAISVIVTMILVHVIMVLRVYALYGESLRVLAFLGTILLAEILCMIVPMYISPVRRRHQTSMKHADCLMRRSGNRTTSAYWIIPLVLDTAVFVLTLRKSRQYAKSAGGARITILKRILRDGTLFYLVIGVTHVLNMFFYGLAPVTLKSSASGFGQAMTAIIASRLVINLRKQSRKAISKDGHDGTVIQSNISRDSNHSVSPYFTSLISVGTFFDSRLRSSDLDTLQLTRPCAGAVTTPLASVVESREVFPERTRTNDIEEQT